MVTTIEGTRKRVTMKPLSAPASTPTARPIATTSGIGAPAVAAAPMAVDEMAMIEATDRSISPAMISSAMAKPIIAFSVKLKVASDRLEASRKYGEAKELTKKIAAATTTRMVSQRFHQPA